MDDDRAKEMIVRHDERIARLETGQADLSRIVTEQRGYQEGWWQARRESLIEDIRVEVDLRALKTARRMMWLAVGAVITAGVIGLKDYIF